MAMASDVFEVMLYGPFRESKMGPDEPIELASDIEPEVFDCAMR
jgi:hypothetical protein